jgi:superoxide dismutase, Cu-Zn family
MKISAALSAIALTGIAAGAVNAAHHGDKTSAEHKAQQAVAKFVNREGTAIGSATLIESPNGVLIYLDLHDLPAGPKGIHIHSVGDCDDRDEGFVASKGHLNPDNKEHGLMNPAGPDAGDLPNVIVHADGTVQVEIFSALASLGGVDGRAKILDDDGAALVIHQNRDDHITQPIGGAGPRIACGVIKAE